MGILRKNDATMSWLIFVDFNHDMFKDEKTRKTNKINDSQGF